MDKIAQHKVLVAGESYEHCCEQVRKFFALTSLVMYDCIKIIEEKCVSGQDKLFIDTVSKAEDTNKQTVQSLVEELQQTGVTSIAELSELEHGYPSKVLHVLSHMLDGFIGIDSYFYNLSADSHWLGKEALVDIQHNPAGYWLIHIDCFSASPEDAGLLRM